jgi:lysophospholipase L1-like esterase
VPMVWSAVLPTAHPRIDAQAVASVNAVVRSVCEARPRCTFVPAPPWQAGYLLADGVHLSAAGYAAWTAALRR